MSIVSLLVPLAAGLGLCFAAAFVWMALNGQFDELDTPAHRILLDDSFKAPIAAQGSAPDASMENKERA